MRKIIKYFPLNKGIVEEEMKTLIKALAIYLGTAIIVLTISNITDRIPIVKNLTFNISNIYGYYILVGIGLACYQYFKGKDYSDEEFITLNDIISLWNSKKGKIILAAVLVGLCLIPHKDKVKPVSVQMEVAREENRQESATEITEVGRTETKVETTEDENITEEVKNDKESDSRDENITSDEEMESAEVVESESNILEEDETVVSKETIEFYEYAKGYWSGEDITFSFLRNGNRYYFLHSKMSYGNEEQVPFYDVTSLEKTEQGILSILIDQNKKSYQVEIMDENEQKSMTIKEVGNEESISLLYNTCSNYDEFLAKDMLEVSYLAVNNLYTSIERTGIEKGKSKFALIDMISELEGNEILISPYGVDGRYYVWGMLDGIICPLGGVDAYMQKERYNPMTKTFYGFFYGGTSGGSTYQTYSYDIENGVLKSNETDSAEGMELYYSYVNSTDSEEYYKIMEKEIAKYENENYDRKLIEELVQENEKIPSSDAWDDLKIQFDNQNLVIGKTKLTSLMENGWESMRENIFSEYIGTRFGMLYYNASCTLENYNYRDGRMNGGKISEVPYRIDINVYDEVENENLESKIIYEIGEIFIEQEDIDLYPELVLPQGITYSSTRQDVVQAYGKPTLVVRNEPRNETTYIYYSDDYVSTMEFSFVDGNNSIRRMTISDEFWFNGNAEYIDYIKKLIRESREGNLKLIQEQ